MKKIEVKYQVSFSTTIEVPDNPSMADIDDAVSNIDIPENETSRYVADSFGVVNYKVGEDK